MEQGKKFDTDKNRLELVPPELIEAVGQILTHGAEKYASYNWCKGLDYGRVYGALQRHLQAFWKGENLDPESGLSHLHHAACNLAFLITYETHPDIYKPHDNRFVYLQHPRPLTDEITLAMSKMYEGSNKVSAYLSHYIRGREGKKATNRDMINNCNAAIKMAAQLRKIFPKLDIYVPAEHDEFVMYAYRAGILTEKQILDTDCEILEKRKLLLIYAPDNGYLSRGMKIESRYATKIGIHIVKFEVLDKDTMIHIKQAIEYCLEGE